MNVASTPPARGFRLAALLLVVVVLGGQLPSPLYAVYADELGLSSFAVTALFTAYVAGVLLALLTCGHVSEHAGRRRVAALALALSAASDLVFIAGAHHYPLLVCGRLLSGLAIGLLTSAAAAHLVELAPPQRRATAGRVSGVATVVGGGSGALLAGAIAQWVAAPTVAAYAVHLGLLAVCAALLALVPETVATRPGARPRAPRVAVPQHARRGFAAAAGAGFCAFALLGLVSALTGSFLEHALHERSRLLAGAMPCAVALLAVAAPPLVQQLPAARAARIGLCGLVPALALLVGAIALPSLPLFVAAMALGGASFGIAFQGGLRAVHELGGERPAERFSAFYVAAYAGMALPVLGAGLLADRLSQTATVALFAAAIALLAAAAAVLAHGPRTASSAPPAT